MNSILLMLDYINKMKTEITNGLDATKITKTEYALLNAILEELTEFVIQLGVVNQQMEEQKQREVSNMDEVNAAMLDIIVAATSKYKNNTKNYQIYMEALEDFMKKLQIKNRIANAVAPVFVKTAVGKEKKEVEKENQSEKAGTYCNFDDSSRAYTMTFKSKSD